MRLTWPDHARSKPGHRAPVAILASRGLGVAELYSLLRREVTFVTAWQGAMRPDQALLFAAGIPREQAFGGRRKPLPRVWSLLNNAVNLGASIRGDARIGWYG